MLSMNIINMDDNELSESIKRLIETRETESECLDYKKTLDTSKDSWKKELAKDVSSFANTYGGILIYGVPEVNDGDLPIPESLEKCGMNIDRDLPKVIEDVLVKAVQPPLHGLAIKVVEISEIAPKKLLVIYQPESYWKPHMVQSYRDQRYYKRCNFQSAPMCEREVEAAYLAREASRHHAEDFFNTALFGQVEGIYVRVVACPVMPGRFKDRMFETEFRDWLIENPPLSPNGIMRCGEWSPFLDGWKFRSHGPGNISGHQYEIRVFYNGAVCLNLDPLVQ